MQRMQLLLETPHNNQLSRSECKQQRLYLLLWNSTKNYLPYNLVDWIRDIVFILLHMYTTELLSQNYLYTISAKFLFLFVLQAPRFSGIRTNIFRVIMNSYLPSSHLWCGEYLELNYYALFILKNLGIFVEFQTHQWLILHITLSVVSFEIVGNISAWLSNTIFSI